MALPFLASAAWLSLDDDEEEAAAESFAPLVDLLRTTLTSVRSGFEDSTFTSTSFPGKNLRNGASRLVNVLHGANTSRSSPTESTM